MQISLVQFLLLAATGVLFAGAFFLGLTHMRRVARAMADAPAGLSHDVSMGTAARAAVLAATLVGLSLFIWRTFGAKAAGAAASLPGSNPFDAFLLLALLLSLVLVYLRWTRHLRSLAFFLLPMIVILLVLGMALAALHQRTATSPPDYLNIWVYVHLVTIVASTICFALACVGGAVYLLADRQLRLKGLSSTHSWIGWPPLASIEKFNRWMVYTGFPLLTISTVAGILQIRSQEAHTPGISGAAKMGFGILSWLVYAVLLHVPLNPRFRGRRAAWLAIFGFVLFLVAFAAAKWST